MVFPANLYLPLRTGRGLLPNWPGSADLQPISPPGLRKLPGLLHRCGDLRTGLAVRRWRSDGQEHRR